MAKSAPAGGRRRVQLDCSGSPEMTQQHFKDECDVNVMVRRFGREVWTPRPDAPVGRYGDFAEAPDFLEAQLLLNRAAAQFNSLPAKVRRRFDNDPAKLLAFVGDKSNTDEARELGLLSEVAPPVVPPGAPPGEAKS